MEAAKALVPAASVIVIRPASSGGFETLLLKRNHTVPFAANYWVFPGGKIEEFDYGANDNELDAALNAAIRECKEEAGIDLVSSQLQYFSTWTAPLQAKKRFITHFFVAEVAWDQTVNVDGWEIVQGEWLPLSEAVAKGACGEYKMMPPTIVSLFDLRQNNSASDMQIFLSERPYFDYAPKIVRNDEGFWAVYPGDSAWISGNLKDTVSLHRLHESSNGVYCYYRGNECLR